MLKFTHFWKPPPPPINNARLYAIKNLKKKTLIIISNNFYVFLVFIYVKIKINTTFYVSTMQNKLPFKTEMVATIKPT